LIQPYKTGLQGEVWTHLYIIIWLYL